MAGFNDILDETNFPQDLRALARAVYSKESRSGEMDTSRPNYAGANGPMQMTKPTFDGLKRDGWIPESYNFNDPKHTTIAGLANIVALDAQFGGDPRAVAAAYYAGPKAVKPDGRIKPLRDRRNPRAPNAQQYAEDVVGSIATDETGFSQFIAGKRAGVADRGAQARVDALLEDFAARDNAPLPATAPPVSPQNPTAAPNAAPDTSPQGGGTGTAERTLGQKLGRVGVEVAGGIAGGVAGSLGGPVGSAAGAAAGSAAGSGLASATFDPLPAGEAAKEAAIAGVFSLAGSGIGKAASMLFRPKGLVAGGKELTDVLAAKGIVPTPAQVFEGAQTLENLGLASLVGAGSLRKARDAATAGVRETAEQWKARWLAAEPQGQRMLQQVEVRADQLGVQVPTAELKNVAETMRKIFTNVDSAGRKVADDIVAITERNPTLPFAVPFDQAIIRNAAATAQQQATGIVATPQLQGAQQVRTKLIDVIRTSSNRDEIQAAKQTIKVLDSAISGALAKADPALHGQWRMGNAFYKAGKQGEEISTIMSKALVSGGEAGEMGGKQLINQIKEHRLANLGSQLTDQQVQRLNEFGLALKAAEGTGDHAFQFVGRGMQVNAVIKTTQALVGAGGVLGQGNLPPGVAEGAIAVALGPVAIAKIFASPTTFRLMMTAMKAKPGTVQSMQAGTNFVLQAIHEGIITTPNTQPATPIPQ